MYNVKVREFENGFQTRIYSRSVLSGDELKILRQELLDEDLHNKEILYNLYLKRCPDFDKFLDFDEFLSLTDFDECTTRDNSDRIVKQNLKRAKTKIFDYARSNTWDYFVTLTFDRSQVDSTNYDLVIKKVSVWLNNMRRLCPDLKYLFVPEFHSDGCHYHFHGLLANCENLNFVDSGIKKNNKTIYNIGRYNWGWSTASKVESSERVSFYITKYISKDLEEHISGKHHYIVSNNCELPKEVTFNMSDNEITDFLSNLPNIASMKNVSNIFNSVAYFETKL